MMKVSLLLILMVAALGACSRQGAVPSGSTISGTVTLAGSCPADPVLNCSADCGASSVTEQHWQVRDGRVANAFVFIKEGLANSSYDAPSDPAILDQKGCAYVPHVMGLVQGQTLKITSSDPTLHTVHLISSAVGESFNRAFMQGAPPVDLKMDSIGVMKTIKCDVHSWMNCYVGVLPHPFFAVSDSTGRYEIHGVPPGEYTLELWHESSHGADSAIVETQLIVVKPRGNPTADFAISAR